VKLNRMTSAAAAAAVFCTALSACVPLVVGGAAMGGGMVAADRRTTGIQIEDESIELRAASRVRDLATLGHVNVTSYNRVVLITGEVPGAAEKAAVEQAVARIENVRSVVNELGIGQNSSIGSRTTDSFITTKVKATLVDAKDAHANAYKVVVERAIVYLMGRVTEREAARGTDLARSVSGVQKVVRAFEILSEEELAALGPVVAPSAAPASAAAGPKTISAPAPPPEPMPAPTPVPTK
jgi:osmotically-inducible protein OsmY